jgi:hypothetical protein
MFDSPPPVKSPREVIAQRLIHELASLAELRVIALAYAKTLAIPDVTRIEDVICDERRRFHVDGLSERDAKFVAMLAGIGCAMLRCDAIEEALRQAHIQEHKPCSSPPAK